MVTERGINVIVQVLLVSFVPVANIWAFYRIHNLRKMVTCIVIPTVIFIAVIGVLIYTSGVVMVCLWNMDDVGSDNMYFVYVAGFEQEYGLTPDYIELARMIFDESNQSGCPNWGAWGYTTVVSIAGGIIHVWAIYLICRWSRKWNDGLGDRSSAEPTEI